MILTEEKVKEFLKDKLFIGKTAKIEQWKIAGWREGSRKYREFKKGKVIGMYKHIFMVDYGKTRECFRYCQIFERGEERVILS